MKKSGVKIAKAEAKKVVKAAVKKEVKKELPKAHQKGGKKSGSKAGGTASSSMRGQKTYNAPVAVGMSTRSYFQVKNLTSGKYKGGVRVTGRDYFATANWLTSSAVGSALVNVPLNPSALVGTRLAQFTDLYEKYRFNKFKVYACPTASTSTSGAYGMSYDRDPSDPTPAVGDPGIRQYMSFEGSTTASAWLQSELVCPLMEPVTDFFVNAVSGGDERIVDQGQFYLWVYTACSANIKIALEIEYDLTLYVPQSTGSVGAIQETATTAAITKKVPQVGAPSVASEGAWNAFNATWATSNQANWGSVTLGDVAKFLNVGGATVNAGIQVAGGLYTLYQSIKGITNTAAAASTFCFDYPSFTANDPREQSLYTVEQVVNNLGVADGTSLTYGTNCVDNLYIPPAGGIITGRYWSDTTANNAITLNTGAKMNILLMPGAPSVSPTGLFTMMLGKPGKFGDEHRRKYRELRQGPLDRRGELEVKLKDPASIESSSVPPSPSVPRDIVDTNLARAEALQAAAKLLGIK